MGYVIRRNDGKYVAKSGSEHSYTSRLEDAERWRTATDAERNRCVENETVHAVEWLLQDAK